MTDAPPAFQEAPRCAICASLFSTFRRRHHCRCCGRSLCNEHSTHQMELPQFGIKPAVRVCDDCFKSLQQSTSEAMVSEADINDLKVTDSIFRLHLSPDSSPPLTEERPSVVPDRPLFECSCGMPLCICQARTAPEVTPSTQTVATATSNKTTSMPSVTNSTASKPSVTNSTASKLLATSYGNSLPSLFFSTSKMANGGSLPTSKKYDVTGEGMREAIKNGDVAAVKDLLANGVDPNHLDKQGMSLLHLAAVFNLTEIAFLLMDAGAKIDARNAQGETPVDCAQATLQYKMQQKIKTRTNGL